VQDLNFAHVANAIAAFERIVRGDGAALTPEQVAGALEFFGPAGCNRCHSGSLFSDQDHHNIGLPQLGPDFDVDAVVEFLYALTAQDASALSEVVPASVPSGLPIF